MDTTKPFQYKTRHCLLLARNRIFFIKFLYIFTLSFVYSTLISVYGKHLEMTQPPYYKKKIYMLFAGREVRIAKNCARGLEYGPRPQAEGRAEDQGHSFSQYGPT